MKLLVNIILMLWMGMSVGVQINDPDGALWIAIYGYGLVMVFMAMAGRYKTPLLLLGIIGYTIGGFVAMPDTFADLMDSNEEARECIGLFISGGCVLILLLQKLMSKDKSMAVEDVVKPLNE
jgi:hypothetical protein